jgi:hypothetical protein
MGSLLHGFGTTDIEMAIYGLILVVVMMFRSSENTGKFPLFRKAS